MQRYEYRLLHMPTTSVSVLNERINNEAKEGWEPFMMSGNDFVNVLMRRPLDDKEQAQES